MNSMFIDLTNNSSMLTTKLYQKMHYHLVILKRGKYEN